MTTIAEIVTLLGAEDRVRWLRGSDPATEITGPAPLDTAGPGTVSFLRPGVDDPTAMIARSAPTLLVLERTAPVSDEVLRRSPVMAVIDSENSRLEFMRILERFFVRVPPASIHASAQVSPTARIGEGVSIGPLCTVAEDCTIGDGTVLAAGVHLYAGVVLGRNVQIHSGAVVGADGFGYERTEAGGLEKFPHVGWVEIGDDVEIGANACIDRGTLGATRIGRGSKIDNLVHIGHNVVVGEDSVVIALAMIGGSTQIGDRTWISPSACLRDNLEIGDDVTVGLASVVTKGVVDGATVLGAPARDIAEYKALLETWKRSLGELGR